MRIKKKFETPGFLAMVVLFGILLLGSWAWAAGVYDGEWEGTTSSGNSIRFTVVDDTITYLSHSITFQCRDGSTATWGFGHSPDVSVASGSFTYKLNIGDNGFPVNGRSYYIVLEGQFTSTETVEGTRGGGLAAFRGMWFRTLPCFSDDTWTAQKIKDTVSESQSDQLEYAVPLE